MNDSWQNPGTDAGKGSNRLASIDVARGLIIALMGLDHVRMFFTGVQFDPLDLSATTPGWFFTRWVTHLCAPGFFFLAGLGAALLARRASRKEVAQFLAVRGLLLIAFEILVFGLAWSFNPGWFFFGVIWGLGVSMILLAIFVWLGSRVVLAAGILFAAGHGVFWGWTDLPDVADAILYSGGVIETGIVGPRYVLYAILPWFALMAIGFGMQPWLVAGQRIDIQATALAGIGFVTLGFALRFAGIGADEQVQAFAAGESHPFLALLNIEKYPPSLQFSLITLGIVLLVVVFAESVARRRSSKLLTILRKFGEVPFLFYALHLFLIHALALGFAIVLGWQVDFLYWSGVGPNLVPPPGYGFGLAGVYAVWLLVLALLFPVCAKFAKLKARREIAWLRYT